VPDEWIEVAWLEPTAEANNRSSEAKAVLGEWLRDHGIALDEVADDDIRIHLVYLGPERGVCGTRVLVRRGVGGT
jgi:hypothetical protein